jgi:hypothetical protein
MKRRHFLAAPAAASVLASSSSLQGQETTPKVIELRWFKLRTSTENQRARLTESLSIDFLNACQRQKVGPVGLFGSSIGPDTPFILLAIEHASLAAFEENWNKLMADVPFQRASERFVAGPRLYERMEVQLLKAWKGFPAIEVRPADAGRAPRIFELRTYESNDVFSLAKKVGMFEGGEIDIFRKSGLLPVFFGSTIAGTHMPNLTYMIAFDSLAAREANWRTFASSPEWKKLSATPGLSDAETVSNITNMILTPLRGSMIR